MSDDSLDALIEAVNKKYLNKNNTPSNTDAPQNGASDISVNTQEQTQTEKPIWEQAAEKYGLQIDFDKVQEQEEQSQKPIEKPSATVGQTLQDIGTAALQGSADVMGGEAKIYDRVLDKVGNADILIPPLRMVRGVKKLAQAIKGEDTSLDDVAKDIKESLPEVDQTRGHKFHDALVGLASSAPSMAATALNPVAGAAVTYAQIVGNTADELASEGIDDERALTTALISSIPEAGIEYASDLFQLTKLKGIFKAAGVPAKTGFLTKLTKFVKNVVLGAASEGGEEYAQNAVHEAAKIMAHNPDASFEDLAKKYYDLLPQINKQGIEQAELGAIGGGFLQAAGGAIKGTMDAITPKDYKINPTGETTTTTEQTKTNTGDLDSMAGIKVEDNPSAMNAGGSSADIINAKQQELTAKQKAEQNTRSQLERQQQAQAQQEREWYDHQNKQAKEQEFLYNQNVKAENDNNQDFFEILKNPSATLDLASKMILPLKNSENKAHRQAIAPIEKAYRALVKGEENLSKMQDISIDLGLMEGQTENDKMGALIGAIKGQIDERVDALDKKAKIEKAQKEQLRPKTVTQEVDNSEYEAAKAVQRGDKSKQLERARTITQQRLDEQKTRYENERLRTEAVLQDMAAKREARTRENIHARIAEFQRQQQEADSVAAHEQTRAKLKSELEARAKQNVMQSQAVENQQAQTRNQQAQAEASMIKTEPKPVPLNEPTSQPVPTDAPRISSKTNPNALMDEINQSDAEANLNVQSNTESNSNVHLNDDTQTTTQDETKSNVYPINKPSKAKALIDKVKSLPIVSNNKGFVVLEGARKVPDDIKQVHNKYIHTDETVFQKVSNLLNDLTTDFKGTIKEHLDKFKAGSVDYLNPFNAAEKGKNIPAHLSGYIAKRLKSTMPQIFGGILNDGVPRYDKDIHWIRIDNSGGLLNVLKDLGPDADYFKLHWLAKSAKELLRTRPNSVTAKMFGADENGNYHDPHSVISEFENATKDRYAANKEVWDKAESRFKEFNESILNFAIDAGVLSKESVDAFKREIYVPFNRVAEDIAGDVFKLVPKGNKKFVSGVHKMKGSKLKMNDPFENLLSNYAYLMNQSLENVARKKAMIALKEHPELIKKADLVPTDIKLKGSQIQAAFNKLMGTPGESHDLEPEMRNAYLDIVSMMAPIEKGNVINIRINGKPQYFEVLDKDLFDAFTDLSNNTAASNMFTKTLSVAKRAMTLGVTLRPGFRLLNFMRDTLHTSVVSKDFVPVISSAKAFWGALWRDQDMKDLTNLGGAFGGSYYSADAGKTINEVINKSTKTSTIRTVAKPAVAIWDAWERVGEAAENAARLALFKNLKAKGVSDVEAAFKAKDLMDFSMRGGNQLVQTLTKTVPFLNARIQGLYKLGRSATSKETAAHFWASGALMAAASTALYAFNIAHNEDKWDKLEDFEKANYFHFWIGDTHLRLPVPFEVGMMFGTTIPAALDSQRKYGTEFTKYLADQLINTFKVNPLTLAQPYIDVERNKDSFTGRPIVPLSLDKEMNAGLKATQWNSETLKYLGEKFGFSPAKSEKLLKSYFGYMVELPIAAADIATRHLTDAPNDPAATNEDHWFYGRILRNDIPRNTKWETEFYDLVRNVDNVWNTFSQYRALNQKEKALDFRTKNIQALQLKGKVTEVQKKIKILNDRRKLIYQNRDMTPEQKREKLDEIQVNRNAIFEKGIKGLRDNDIKVEGAN